MQRHFPWKELGYATGVVCLLLALYAGAYFATVIPQAMLDVVTEPVVGTKRKQAARFVKHAVASYRYDDVFGSDRMVSFFAPIHQIDRRFRTRLWKDVELDPPDLLLPEGIPDPTTED